MYKPEVICVANQNCGNVVLSHKSGDVNDMDSDADIAEFMCLFEQKNNSLRFGDKHRTHPFQTYFRFTGIPVVGKFYMTKFKMKLENFRTSFDD